LPENHLSSASSPASPRKRAQGCKCSQLSRIFFGKRNCAMG
jgi:hypothetical protein